MVVYQDMHIVFCLDICRYHTVCFGDHALCVHVVVLYTQDNRVHIFHPHYTMLGWHMLGKNSKAKFVFVFVLVFALD